MQLQVAFLYSYKFVHLFILELLVHVLPALSYTHRITFFSRFKCNDRLSCVCLSYIEADRAIANMNEFPMFPAIYG